MSEAEKEKESGEREREREGEVGYSLQKSLRWRTREGGMRGDVAMEPRTQSCGAHGVWTWR